MAKPSSCLDSCEFCNSRAAVLHCAADSANLCLICDTQVHSANDVSLKHSRSPLCQICGKQSASFHCGTKLVVCKECDWKKQDDIDDSVPCLVPVDGFAGCPPPLAMASAFGFDFNISRFQRDSDSGFGGKPLCFAEIVANNNSSGLRREACRQLAELETYQLEIEKREEEEMQLLLQQTPFTSLLMSPSQVGDRETTYCVADGDLMWSHNPAFEAAQILDFQLGKSAGYGAEDPNFRAEHYQTPVEEYKSPFLDDAATREDVSSSSRNSCSEQLSKVKASPETQYCSGPEEDWSTGAEAADWLKAKVDFAENRGNAMLRYKEKKKNRRLMLLSISFFPSLGWLVQFIGYQNGKAGTIREFDTSPGRPGLIQESESKVGLQRLVRIHDGWMDGKSKCSKLYTVFRNGVEKGWNRSIIPWTAWMDRIVPICLTILKWVQMCCLLVK
ncbi:Zinc finger protein CONSTANS-LIKE 14 [Linum grandiflorum]